MDTSTPTAVSSVAATPSAMPSIIPSATSTAAGSPAASPNGGAYQMSATGTRRYKEPTGPTSNTATSKSSSSNMPPTSSAATGSNTNRGGNGSHTNRSQNGRRANGRNPIHTEGRSHDHEQGGHHGGGHSHSHDHGGHAGHGGHGAHAADGHSSEMDDAMAEAQHYCDVIHHIERYGVHTSSRIDKFESDFKKIHSRYRALVPGFAARVARIREGIRINQQFIAKIVAERRVFMNADLDYDAIMGQEGPVNEERQSKVRSTIRQCVRDWADEGVDERKQCYGPILAELQSLYPDFAKRADLKVLVPGSGLGRLVWDVANLGFQSQGNEFSYFMLVASFVILNCVDRVKQFQLFPFIDDTKNLLRVDDQFMSVHIPDVDPRTLPPQSKFSMVAGDFLECYGKDDGVWDCISTCFFIDTANNILHYIDTFSHILKPGGYWINLGPLLYHFSDMDRELSIDLTFEEIKASLLPMGFKLLKEQHSLPCTYTAHKGTMLNQQYYCVFFVCVKLTDHERDMELAKLAAGNARTTTAPTTPATSSTSSISSSAPSPSPSPSAAIRIGLTGNQRVSSSATSSSSSSTSVTTVTTATTGANAGNAGNTGKKKAAKK